jgi:lipopolysaccharide transport system ATP-binding protein
MSKPIIEVNNLSKQYTIGERARYGNLREEIMQTVTAPFRRSSRPSSNDNTIWALKDVSFEVKEGEVLGIIGRNGAGKSTLLKILSRITEPTGGRVELRGRVASLLEVGTGFHPELTGRENILLNGALLGMSRQEITRKLDEIVAFSEIEKFLDTPVKRYSSGMYVRLAFAVAAHLEPDILLVDEVLAVGDASFQKKCLGKMGDVARGGRTVLFVSHNMTAVASLTERCIELADGGVAKLGPSDEVIQHYLTESVGQLNTDGNFDLTNAARPLRKVNLKTAKALFVKARCIDSKGKGRTVYQEREKITIDVYVRVRSKIDFFEVHLDVNNTYGIRVFAVLSDVIEIALEPGLYKISLDISPNYLRPGDYYSGISLYAPALQDGIRYAVNFRVEPSAAGDSNVNWSYHALGVVRFPYKWTSPEAVAE